MLIETSFELRPIEGLRMSNILEPKGGLLHMSSFVGSWTLVDEDRRLIANKTGATRLGFALLLKFFELDARFPASVEELPPPAVAYVAERVKVDPADLSAYRWTGRTIEYHRAQVRDAFGFREFTRGDEDKLAAWLVEEVCPVELREEQLREALLVRCRTERIEPSGRPDRIIGAGRALLRRRAYQLVTGGRRYLRLRIPRRSIRRPEPGLSDPETGHNLSAVKQPLQPALTGLPRPSAETCPAGEIVVPVERAGPHVELRISTGRPDRRSVGDRLVPEDLCGAHVDVRRRQPGQVGGAGRRGVGRDVGAGAPAPEQRVPAGSVRRRQSHERRGARAAR
jgi:hypothetical protein